MGLTVGDFVAGGPQSLAHTFTVVPSTNPFTQGTRPRREKSAPPGIYDPAAPLEEQLQQHGQLLSRNDAGDEPRFAGIFKHMWKRIPAKARQTLIRWWECDSPPTQVIGHPSIEMTAFLEDDGSGALARAALMGLKLTFSAPAVEVQPDELVATQIAHELAHVFRWANGTCSVSKRRRTEREAEAITIDWGFDVFNLNAWWHEYFTRYGEM